MSTHKLNLKTNDLVLLLQTVWMYWNCLLLPVTTDGMDGNGLKLEKKLPIFSSFDAAVLVPKILKKFITGSPL